MLVFLGKGQLVAVTVVGGGGDGWSSGTGDGDGRSSGGDVDGVIVFLIVRCLSICAGAIVCHGFAARAVSLKY